MKTTKRGVDLIQEFEGLRLEAYLCPAKVWTIGYGHTGTDVHEGQKITQTAAEVLLEQDIERTEEVIDKVLKKPLSPLQYSAVVSFTFNLGIGNLKASTLLKKINIDPNDSTIIDEFNKWIYVGKVPMAGLIRRREKEAQMYKDGTGARGAIGITI